MKNLEIAGLKELDQFEAATINGGEGEAIPKWLRILIDVLAVVAAAVALAE